MHKQALQLDQRNTAKKAGDEDKHKAAEGHSDVGLIVKLIAAVKQVLVFNAQGFQLLAGSVVSVMGVRGIISMQHYSNNDRRIPYKQEK